MVQFATAEELGSFLGRRFDPQERGAAELHLRTASAVIQAAAAQVFELVLDDEIDLRYQRGPDLHLPERPVLAVSAVTVDGAAVTDYIVTGSAVSWIGSGLVGVRGFSPELFGVRSWTPAIKVTYSHGYAIGRAARTQPARRADAPRGDQDRLSRARGAVDDEPYGRGRRDDGRLRGDARRGQRLGAPTG
jgi:hypothetical protein